MIWKINVQPSREILQNNQFGIHSKHSTTYALLLLTNKIQRSITDNGTNTVYPCSVFLDLCKAFDSVDHQILSANLEYYGMQGVANDWFASCLSNRRHFVSLFHRNCDCQTVAYVEYHRDQCLAYFSFFNKQNDLPKCSKHLEISSFCWWYKFFS